MKLTQHDKIAAGLAEPAPVKKKPARCNLAIMAAARKAGLHPSTVMTRIDRLGWSTERAVTEPPRQKLMDTPEGRRRQKLVNDALAKSGKNQFQLAIAVGVHPSTLSDWVHGRNSVPEKYLAALERELK